MTENVSVIQPEITIVSVENVGGLEVFSNISSHDRIELDEDSISGLIISQETVTIVIDGGQTIDVDAGVPGPAASDRNGGVWVLGVYPSGSGAIGDITYLSDNRTVSSFLTSADVVRLDLLALSGHSTYVPTILINGSPIVLTESATKGIFTANHIMDVSALSELKIEHEDGPGCTVSILRDSNPIILSAIINQTYPGTQSELKQGDQITIAIETDIPVNRIFIEDSGIGSGQTMNVALGKTHSITLSAPNRGDSAVGHFGRIKVYSATDAESIIFQTTNSIVLNNIKPSILFGAITYPLGQLALKNDETATVRCTVTNFTTVSYTSANLSIDNPTEYALDKTVTRTSGDYVVTNNMTVSAYRSENGSSSSASSSVKIANVAPLITVTKSATRFRSGGNVGTTAQLHQITLIPNQTLLNAPSMSVPIGNLGVVAGSGSNWIFPISINDDHTKGTHQITLLGATGLSGISTNLISGVSTYVIGGFVKRTMIVPAFPVRSVEVGTIVSDVSKLRCSNLSKGQSGSNNFTYQATTDEALNKYTILNLDTWYNCDGLNASSNTTGSMQIELEEIV